VFQFIYSACVYDHLLRFKDCDALRYCNLFSYPNISWDSSASTVTILRAGSLGFGSRQRQGFLLFETASRQALRPIQPAMQWLPGVFIPGSKLAGM